MKKEIPIKFEDKNYLCKLESTDSNLINIELSQDLILKYNGTISIKDICDQIRAFSGYSMEEIFSAMKDISQEKFNLIKKSDKLELDIAFKVMKKEKHLFIKLNEVHETKADIIKHLMEIIKNQKERINALKIGINELKIKKEKKEKENKTENKIEDIQKDDPDAIDISKYIYEKEIEGVNSGANSLLILQDGRISLGTAKTWDHERFNIPCKRETGIYIYNPITSKTLTIPYYGPKQIQLKNGLLLITDKSECQIKKLIGDNDYKYKKEIKFNNFEILYVEELSNNMLAFSLGEDGKYRIAIYEFNIDEREYERKFEIYTDYMSCGFILNLKDNEMLYICSSDFNDKKTAVFYDYENEKKIKTFDLNIDFDYTFISRLSNKIIAISENQKITLIDIDTHEIIKSIDTKKNIHCLFNLKDKYLIVANYDTKKNVNQLQQYEIEEEGSNLKLITEKNDIEIGNDYIKAIGCLKDEKLVLLSFSGYVKILSTEKM